MCGALNRQSCQVQAGMCGECIAPYIGLPCSNLPCNASTSMRRPGETCVSNAVCISGVCLSGVCTKAIKPCPGGCLGNGRCSFVDLLGKPVDTCWVGNASCLAVCKCNSGRFGRDCSYSASDYATQQSVRGLLCDSLLGAFQISVSDFK